MLSVIRHASRIHFSFSLVCMLLVGSLSWAQNTTLQDPSISQDLQQIAPRAATPSVSDEQAVADKPKVEVKGSTQVLAKAWGGLVLQPNESSVVKAGIESMSDYPQAVDKIAFVDLNTPKPEELSIALRAIMAKKPISRRTINEVSKTVFLHYQRNDFPLVDVYLPEHAMKHGIVQLVVLEGKLGEVKVEGHQYFSSESILKNIRTKRGGLIRNSTMQEDIAWINKNPFRRSEILYEQGEARGTTNAVVKVKDVYPMRFNVGYNDSGNRLTSYETWTAGLNWGKPFGYDDQLNYAFTTRLKTNYLQAHSLTYIKPLPWRHTLTFMGSYSDSDLDALRISTPAILELNSRSWSLGARYQMPLEWLVDGDTISLGFDFKRSKNGNAILGRATTTNTKTDVSQFSLTYQGTIPIEKGMISVGSTLIWSPGGWGGYNEKPSLPGDPHYFIGKVNAMLYKSLPHEFSLMLRTQLQVSEDQVAGSEQMSLGGFGTVRGYDPSEAVGENGYLFVAELYTPKTTTVFSRIAPKQFEGESLQFLVFSEYGGTQLINPTVNEDEHANLFSLGGGLRYSLGSNLNARFDYGYQLMDSQSSRSSRNTRNSRAHFAIDASF